MKKTALFAVAASAAALFALPAAAQGMEGLYVQGNLGYSLAGSADVDITVTDGTDTETASGEVDLDNGWLVSGALGTSLGGVRVEGEVLYTSNDLADTDDEDLEFTDVTVTQWAVMANALYDFALGGVTPYVGAGIGYGSTNLEVEDGDLDDAGLAWQLRGGVTFGEAVKWDIGYRYLNFADFEADMDEEDASVSLEAAAAVHAVSVGVRIPLGG